MVFAAAVFLTACAAPPEQSPQTPPPISQAENLALAPVPENIPPSVDKAAETDIEIKQTASIQTKDYAALVPEGNRDPGTLLGLNPDRLIEILGPPGFRRADAPAEIWQYQHGGCVLNLILYETGTNKALNVKHYTIRFVKKNEISDWNCLLALLIDRQKKLDGFKG